MPDPRRDRPDESIPGDYRDYLLRQGRWAPGYDAEQARLAAAAEAAERSCRPIPKPWWRRVVDAHPWLVYGGAATISLVGLGVLGSLIPEDGTTGAPAPTPTPVPSLPPSDVTVITWGSLFSYLLVYGGMAILGAVTLVAAGVVKILERIGPWRLKAVPGVDPLERFRRPSYLTPYGPRWREWRKSVR